MGGDYGVKVTVPTAIHFLKSHPDAHVLLVGIADQIDKALKLTPSNETPALAKANNGIIPNATYFVIPCSSFNSKDLEGFFLSCGISNANSTPDIVACTPDWCVKSHNKIPINK